KFEGMLVRVTSPMTLTGGFNLQTFGEMEISSGGRLFTPTQVAEPGAAANSVLASYDARRVILNDFSRQSNITSIPYYPSFSATNTLRAGVEVNPNWTAVVDYRFGAYQLNPTVVLTLNTATNPRPSAPASVGTGSRVFKVAGSNVLNFFTTLNSRGANTAGELATQRAKIVAALRTLDADVIGLTEIQNNGATLPISDSQAIGNLLNALNATPGDQYTLVPTGGSLGSDLITQAIIYKPSRVTPIGSFASQANAGTGRVNLAQRFRPFDGSRTDLQEFTVVVVHWKSKSSSGASGADADQNDGQGAYNATRVQIANDTVSWLASNPTSDPNPAGSRKVVLVGDFNAYRQEDPIDVMVGAGYKPLLDFFTQGFLYYSYNFDNMSGALDHAIASTAFERVTTGTVEYHINADEPAAIDYNTEDSKPASWTDTTQYRASDHDPVLVGFNPLTGDFDNDGDVDSADAAIMRAAIGKPASSVDRRIDMDGDGVISLNDNRLFTLAARAFTIVGI
ncbi:MAG TPA: ExeM/NucH family extracellular endonuclease, partial [Bryobacteraceae bacterium]|nr:ExeM/NucH family extracellular endonuclease [Bryobacteraceae bacterium]